MKLPLVQITRPTAPNPSSVLVLAHGLNLAPWRMDSIGSVFLQNGSITLRIALAGHRGESPHQLKVTRELWLDELQTAFEQAKSTSREYGGVPIYFIGYSLGSILAQDLFCSRPCHDLIPSRQILISTPFALRTPGQFFKKLQLSLPERFCLPSLGFKEYRAHDKTPVRLYRALFESIESVRIQDLSRVDIPTRVFQHPKDELIHPERSQKILESKGLSNWQFFEIDNSGCKMLLRYNHLAVDQNSLGDRGWKSLSHLMLEHLRPG